MVRIGIAGVGFMGRIHYLASKQLRDARVTAICSRDPAKLAGDWRATRGNFGPEPGHVDLAGVKTYSGYSAMLADPDIDLVDICSVTDQHALMATQALQAGKHVLVEKAIALNVADADRMLAAARQAGRLLMVAHVLPFFGEFAFAAEAVRSGRFGKLLAAHFKRVISKPGWSAAIGDAAATGGPAVDLHIHDTHFIGLLCGIPKEVRSAGTLEGDAVTYVATQYLYGPGGPCVTCVSGALAQKGRPFVHGFEVYLERATLIYESGATPLTVLTADGGSEQPALGGTGDPVESFTAELQAACDGVRAGREPDLLSGQLARDALSLCLKECQSVKEGRAVPVE
jgi:predicted dehydrogenase